MTRTILNDKQKDARKRLANLRSDRSLSYRETLKQILELFGSDYEVGSEDVARGILAEMIYSRFVYGNFRNILLIALCLTEEFTMATAKARREYYLQNDGCDFYAPLTSEDAVRKDEDKCFDDLIIDISEKLEQFGDQYLNEMIAQAMEDSLLKKRGDRWEYQPVRIFYYDEKKTSISRFPIVMDELDNQIADDLRRRIEAGKRDIDTSNMMMAGLNSMFDVYAYKYHEHHDLIAKIDLKNFDDYEVNYDLSIIHVLGGEVLRINLPVDINDIKELLGSYRDPLLEFNNFTYKAEPNRTYEYLLSLPGSIMFHHGEMEFKDK